MDLPELLSTGKNADCAEIRAFDLHICRNAHESEMSTNPCTLTCTNTCDPNDDRMCCMYVFITARIARIMHKYATYMHAQYSAHMLTSLCVSLWVITMPTTH